MSGGFKTSYDAGYDCGLNGANTANCHFAYFSTPDETRMWELGKRNAEEERSTTTTTKE